MKIKEIVEGWFSQAVGAFSPRSGNRYDTSRDYKQEDDLYLSKIQADVESGKIDPSEVATGDKQAINPDPSYWAKRQADYMNFSQAAVAAPFPTRSATNQYGVMTAQATPAKYSKIPPRGGKATASWAGSGQQPYTTSINNFNATPAPAKKAKPAPAPAPADPSTMSPDERRKYYNKQFKSGVKVSANRG